MDQYHLHDEEDDDECLEYDENKIMMMIIL